MKNFKNTTVEDPDKYIFINMNLKAICIRIVPNTGSSNFKRNPPFARAFSLAFTRFVTLCENTNCLRIQQFSNHITLAIALDKSTKPFSLNTFLTAVKDIIASVNKDLKQSSCTFTLKAFAAVDQGKTLLDAKMLTHPLYMNYIWLGEAMERSLTLSDIAGTGKYPDLLVTHVIYEQLDPELKADFQKSYYYQHMCCYGKENAMQSADCSQTN